MHTDDRRSKANKSLGGKKKGKEGGIYTKKGRMWSSRERDRINPNNMSAKEDEGAKEEKQHLLRKLGKRPWEFK